MKRIFKKNQIIITVLALMIAVAGYINYADHVKNTKKAENEIISNDAEPVDNDTDGNLEDPTLEDVGGQIEQDKDTVFTSGLTTVNSAFIISAKLEREQVRASNKETLLEIIDNDNVSESDRTVATQKMVAITEAAEKEVAAELMLEAKGFQNVIVSISSDKVDVVVETEELSDAQLAQIEDVVINKTGCTIDQLTITSVSPVSEDTSVTSE